MALVTVVFDLRQLARAIAIVTGKEQATRVDAYMPASRRSSAHSSTPTLVAHKINTDHCLHTNRP
jgi:hypothetical protein